MIRYDVLWWRKYPILYSRCRCTYTHVLFCSKKKIIFILTITLYCVTQIYFYFYWMIYGLLLPSHSFFPLTHVEILVQRCHLSILKHFHLQCCVTMYEWLKNELRISILITIYHVFKCWPSETLFWLTVDCVLHLTAATSIIQPQNWFLLIFSAQCY